MNFMKFFFSFLLVGLSTAPSAMACATCFGASDSPMAQGMNWGIFSLLIVITCMLSGIAGFFFFLSKKSAQTTSAETKNV